MSAHRVDTLPDIAADIRQAHTLPASAYTDPQIFTTERERIFACTWQAVASRRRIDFADLVQREDAAICQAVQDRLRTGICDRGRLVPGHEAGVHHFQRLLLQYLRGAEEPANSDGGTLLRR